MRRYEFNITNLNNFLNSKEGYDYRKNINYNQIINKTKLNKVLKSFPEFNENDTNNFYLTNTGLIVFRTSTVFIVYDLLSIEDEIIDEVNPDTQQIELYDSINNPLLVRRLKLELNPNGSFFLPKFVGIKVIPDRDNEKTTIDERNINYDFTYQYEFNCDYLNGQQADDDGIFRFVSDDDLFVSDELILSDPNEEPELVITDGYNSSEFLWFTPGFFYKQNYVITTEIHENRITNLNLYMKSGNTIIYPRISGNKYIFDFTNYPNLDTNLPLNLYCDNNYYKSTICYLEVR